MAEGFPTVAGWWWLSLRRGFSSTRQLLSTALVAGLLIAALGVPITLVSGAVSAQQVGAGSQLNTLRVEMPATTEGSGMTAERLNQIAQLPGVSGVVIDLKASIYGDGKDTWDANVQVIRPWLLPPGATTQQLAADQVIVPERIDGVAMDSHVGKTLPISYTRATGESTGEQATATVEVVGTYPAGWSGYGQEAVLGSQELVIKLYAARYGQQPSDVLERSGAGGAWVQADDAKNIDSLATELRSQGLDVTAERDRLGSLPGLLAAFPTLITVVGVGMSLLLGGQILQSVKTSLKQRAREFGLLRMRGYGVPDIRRLVTLEILSGVTLGALIGVIAGMGVGFWLTATLTPRELMPSLGWGSAMTALPLLALIVVGIAALALAVGVFAVQRIMRQDPFLLVMRG